MSNHKFGRSAISLLVASALLSACGSGAGNQGSESRESSESGSVTMDSAAKSHVLVQMTGLLLLVPPTAGDSLHVYLPEPRGIGVHAARLGFAVPLGDTVPPGLCDNSGTTADSTDICYVNLTRWTLQPFGDGGVPATTTLASFPGVTTSGLLNVTHLAGGNHRVFAARADSQSLKVTFLSGQLVDSLACKLAEWSFRRVDQHGTPQLEERKRLSNVVVWEMANLDSAALVFVDSTGRTERIKLPAGETRLLLAHIPVGELSHLPPGHADSVKTAAAAHFQPFYDLLSQSSSNADTLPHGSARRRIPFSPSGDTIPCPVVLQSGNKRVGETKSMATYACIPASGQGG